MIVALKREKNVEYAKKGLKKTRKFELHRTFIIYDAS